MKFLLLAALTIAAALSPHDDILHAPLFRLLLSSKPISNANIPTDAIVIPCHSKTWACTLPTVTPESLDILQVTSNNLSLTEIVNNLNDIGCLYHVQGWFTYEFCFNSHARQFHKKSSPEDESVELDYSLGKFSNAIDSLSLKTGADGRRYLATHWQGGTDCDLTGKPRSIQIQFHCPVLAHVDHISLVQETSTCSYLMIVNTQKLCHDERFNPPGKIVNNVVCNVVVSEEFYQLQQNAQLHGKEMTPVEAAKLDFPPSPAKEQVPTIEISLGDFSAKNLKALLEKVRVEIQEQVEFDIDPAKPFSSLAEGLKKKIEQAHEKEKDGSHHENVRGKIHETFNQEGEEVEFDLEFSVDEHSESNTRTEVVSIEQDEKEKKDEL
jgi:hypothetical protein